MDGADGLDSGDREDSQENLPRRSNKKDLPFTTICAMLLDAGITDRQQIKDMKRWYFLRVIQHPRNKSGELTLPGLFDSEAEEKGVSPEDEIRFVLRLRNYPEHLIEAKVKQVLAANRPQEESATGASHD